MSTKLAVGAVSLGVAGVVLRRALATRTARVEYVLHVYDHCPFCNRVEWLLARFGLPYRRVLYGYGAGADPQKSRRAAGRPSGAAS